MTKEKIYPTTLYTSDTPELYDTVNDIRSSGLEEEVKNREIFKVYEKVRSTIGSTNIVGVLTLANEVLSHILEFPIESDGTFRQMHFCEEMNTFYVYVEDGEVEEVEKVEGVVEV